MSRESQQNLHCMARHSTQWELGYIQLIRCSRVAVTSILLACYRARRRQITQTVECDCLFFVRWRMCSVATDTVRWCGLMASLLDIVALPKSERWQAQHYLDLVARGQRLVAYRRSSSLDLTSTTVGVFFSLNIAFFTRAIANLAISPYQMKKRHRVRVPEGRNRRRNDTSLYPCVPDTELMSPCTRGTDARALGACTHL